MHFYSGSSCHCPPMQDVLWLTTSCPSYHSRHMCSTWSPLVNYHRLKVKVSLLPWRRVFKTLSQLGCWQIFAKPWIRHEPSWSSLRLSLKNHWDPLSPWLLPEAEESLQLLDLQLLEQLDSATPTFLWPVPALKTWRRCSTSSSKVFSLTAKAFINKFILPYHQDSMHWSTRSI